MIKEIVDELDLILPSFLDVMDPEKKIKVKEV
jgi:hypothetical protein